MAYTSEEQTVITEIFRQNENYIPHDDIVLMALYTMSVWPLRKVLNKVCGSNILKR